MLTTYTTPFSGIINARLIEFISYRQCLCHPLFLIFYNTVDGIHLHLFHNITNQTNYLFYYTLILLSEAKHAERHYSKRQLELSFKASFRSGKNCILSSLDPRPHWRWAWYRLFAHAPPITQKVGNSDTIVLCSVKQWRHNERKWIEERDRSSLVKVSNSYP